ncbi:MAG: hypothetical protein AAF738_05975 [Bacteroidota bacterium]
MKNILSTLFIVLTASVAIAQVNITVSVSSVSVNWATEPCDLDGGGTSDPQWDATLTDKRTTDEDFQHEESETDTDITITSGYDNPLTFSQTYNGICPPNFLSVEWTAYEDDAVGTNANTGNNDVILPIVNGSTLMTGTNSYTFSATGFDNRCGNVDWSITFQVTVTGTAPYICADEPCDASAQAIQDGCTSTVVPTRYDVSNSTMTFSSGSTTCPYDGDNDIFFSFVAPASGEVLIDLIDYNDFDGNGLTDLTINLYEGPSCNSLSLVDTETYDSNNTTAGSADCVDLSGGTFNTNYSPIYLENLTPGQTYYMRMSEEQNQESYADLAFEAIVENDDCVNATQLTGTTVFSGCNYNATDEGEPDTQQWTGDAHNGTFGGSAVQNTCGGWSSNENAVWYYFDVTPLTPQPITLNVLNTMCEGGANTLQMGVWYAGNGPSYSCDLSTMPGVGCDANTGDVSVTLGNNVPPGRYYVMLDGNAGSRCTWEFESPQLLRVSLSPKVFLQGPLSGAMMSTDLQTNALLPSTEPYTALGYTFVGGGGETALSSAFTGTGANAVVDWVVVELRNGMMPTMVEESRAALLLANGSVVDVDGLSAVTFNAGAGSYHVAIRHRNHLAVMTNTPLSL